MNKFIGAFLVLSVFLSSCSQQTAKEEVQHEYVTQSDLAFKPRQYVAYKAISPVKVDGIIDEDSWSKAPWTEYFEDIEGDIKPKPLHSAHAKILWDETYLYISAELEEPHVWATLRQRDTIIFYDNDFEVFIDPDGDTHNYYEFEMNAFGTEWDLLLAKPYRDGGPAINGWNINGMKVAVKVYGSINDPSDVDEKWSLEIAMPWIILKECAPESRAPKAGEQWRIDFSRVQWTTDIIDGKYVKRKDPDSGKPLPENNWVWSPQGVINMHLPELWGYVQFSDLIVGQGEEIFVENPDEEIKLKLRKLYYSQKNYFERNQKFASNIEELGVSGDFEKSFVGSIQIETTTNLFEIIVPATKMGETLHIRQDGRVWKD